MEYIGTQLTADVAKIWTAAQKNLPNMAEAYAGANACLAETQSLQDAAGTEFFAKWQLLRDDLQTAFENSAVNLSDTAAALRQGIEDYATEDTAAGEALETIKDEVGDEPPESPETHSVD